MTTWLKWLIARNELRELDQWRQRCNEHIKWLDGDFPQVGDALRNLRVEVTGTWQLQRLRDQMRKKYLAEYQGFTPDNSSCTPAVGDSMEQIK